MATIKISALPDAAALSGVEQVPVVQTGVTVKTTTQDIADLFTVTLPFNISSDPLWVADIPSTIGQNENNDDVVVIDSHGNVELIGYTSGDVAAGTIGFDVNGNGLITGKVSFSPPASVTPATNGYMVFEATSNTTVTLKLKGSDGTVRSAIITLS